MNENLNNFDNETLNVKNKPPFDKKHWEDGIEEQKQVLSHWEERKKETEKRLDELSKAPE